MLFSLCELRLRRFLRRSMMIIAAIPNDTQEYTKMMTEIYRCAFAFSVVMEIAETHGVRRISMVAMSAVVRFEKRFPNLEFYESFELRKDKK